MDPLTAWALAIKAVAEMITEISKGQPPELKARMWERWMALDDRIRKALHLAA